MNEVIVENHNTVITVDETPINVSVVNTSPDITVTNQDANITITEQNASIILESRDSTDEKVRLRSTDTTPSYLYNKLTAGSGITLTVNNSGANETITIASSTVVEQVDLTDDINASSGKIYTNIGASDQVIATITAVAGFFATFIVAVAQEFRIKASAGDFIYDGNLASISGGYIKSDKIGSVLDIYCIDGTNIMVRYAKGDWRLT